MLQRWRKQRHQHGKTVPVNLPNDRDEVVDDRAALLLVALHHRAEIEGQTHVVEANATQLVEIEQRQRLSRARIGRIGVNLRWAFADRFRKLEELNKRRAALE